MYINRRCEYVPAGQSPKSDMTPINECGWYRVYGGGHGRKRNFSVPRRATPQARPRFFGPFLKAPVSPIYRVRYSLQPSILGLVFALASSR